MALNSAPFNESGDPLKIVISLGGSIFSKEKGPDTEYLEKFSAMLKDLSRQHRFYVVTGGGRSARQYIEAGRRFGASEYALDELGIGATRLNARILAVSLGDKGLSSVPSDTSDALKTPSDKVFVMGGTVPGHTTDAVSAMLAKKVEADLLINATNIDGVYDSDPRRSKDAKKLDKLSHQELLDIVKTKDYKAGSSTVFDPKAAEIIKENKIRTIIVDGRDPENISCAINGDIRGTLIC